MNVSLTPELEQLVAAKVASGRYLSASEVVREALRLFEQFDQQKIDKLREIKRDVQSGLADLESGAYTDYDRKQMKARIEQIKKSGRKAKKS